MQYTRFIGIDTGKEQVEIAVLQPEGRLERHTVANQATALKAWIRALRKRAGVDPKRTLVCVEHTGLYSQLVVVHLQQQDFVVWLESATQIQHSQGLQRGKTDPLDAERIARYAQRFADQARPFAPPRELIQRLQALLTLRERLVKTKNQLKVPLDEAKDFMPKAVYADVHQHSRKPLEDLQQAIENVDRAIDELLRSDDHTRDQLRRRLEVDGVGLQTAATIIAETNEFKKFTPHDVKQFACHCGVVPFERQSGTALKRRPRVHHRANKRLKTLLHLCARAAIRSDGELKRYYERQLARGKHTMSVLNAIRHKILLRIFAIMRNGTTYQKNYSLHLAKP